MPKTYYKFMCDSCGYAQGYSGICNFCQNPLTMYSNRARSPHRIEYF